MRLAMAALLAAPAWAPPPPARANESALLPAESYMVVDCLLPGQVRKLGRSTTFLTPRRPMRTSAVNCEIRGGEYVSADRATFESSLGVWLPAAQGGDAKAQAYVGRIYADGFGRPPDFAQAAAWYQKAADQGYPQAMIDLGQLYERGQGVAKDADKAFALYRKAAGLPTGPVAGGDAAALQKVNDKYDAANRELEAARADLAREREALAAARADLERAQAAGGRQASSAASDKAALQRQLDAADAQLQAANARASALATELAKAQAAPARVEPAASAAQQKADAAQRAQLTRERDQMQHDLDVLRSQLPDQQGRVQFLEADAAQAHRMADQATAQLAQAEARMQAQEKELAAARARLADQQARAAANAADAGAAARLREAQAAYDRQAGELEGIKAAAAASQAQLNAAQRASQAREAELAQARAAAGDAQAKLAKAQAEIAARDVRLQAFEARATQAEAKAAQVQRDYQAAQQKSAELAAQVAQLQAEATKARTSATAAASSSGDTAAREAKLAQREARVKELEARLAATYRNAPTPARTPVTPNRMWASSKFGFNQSFAVLIGESDYRDPRLPKLQTPGNDVSQLASLLQDRYGFVVTVMLDKSRAEILRELDALAEKLNENDTLLIYYAGHGGMEKVRNGPDRGYWLPVDAEVGHSAGEISNQEITYQVARMAARKVLIVADSCYSGLLSQTVSRAQQSADADSSSTDYLIGMAHKQSRNVMTSGRLEPVLDGGGPGNHSVFAAALIDVLRSNSDVITSQEIYNRLVTRVMRNATKVLMNDQDLPDPQQPTYSALDNGGHVYGDFVFVPRGPISAVGGP